MATFDFNFSGALYDKATGGDEDEDEGKRRIF
jgi:hypothetical protein